MLRRTRPCSQSYQVAAVWGAPLGLTVATTAGFGRARKASISGGTGTRGTRPRLLRREQVGPEVGLGKPCAENVPVRVARTVREQLAGLGDEGIDTELPRPLDPCGEEGALRALSAVLLERARCAEPAHAVVNEQRARRHRLAGVDGEEEMPVRASCHAVPLQGRLRREVEGRGDDAGERAAVLRRLHDERRLSAGRRLEAAAELHPGVAVDETAVAQPVLDAPLCGRCKGHVVLNPRVAVERIDLVQLRVRRFLLDAEPHRPVEHRSIDAGYGAADGTCDPEYGQPGDEVQIAVRLRLSPLVAPAHRRARLSAQRLRPRYDCHNGIAKS